MSETAAVTRDAAAILRACLRAVDPARRVAEALADEPELERWAGDLARQGAPPEAAGSAPGAGRTLLIAVGKAALGMTRGALGVLGDAIGEGVVLVPAVGDRPSRPDWLPPGLELHAGGHPLPDASGLEAARRIESLARGAGAGDRVLVLLSGGGSALLTSPAPGLVLEDLRETTDLLLKAGLPIEALNCVRKHLERLKGGGLARLAAPARVLGLILSDVPGDSPEVVASGPLSPDGTSYRDAEILLRRDGVWDGLPDAVRAHLSRGRKGELDDTPGPGDPAFANVRLRVVAGGERAVLGARREAEAKGYRTHVLTLELRGEARRAGRGLARVGRAVRDGVGPVSTPACLLAAGETTVRVVGDGRGGRNQEVALAAALALEGTEGIVVGSLGTDGVDGPTDAAGGLVDGATVSRGRAAGQDPEAALAHNDAYTFLDAAGALLRTGPTGTNVADVMVVVIGAADSRDRS